MGGKLTVSHSVVPLLMVLNAVPLHEKYSSSLSTASSRFFSLYLSFNPKKSKNNGLLKTKSGVTLFSSSVLLAPSR